MEEISSLVVEKTAIRQKRAFGKAPMCSFLVGDQQIHHPETEFVIFSGVQMTEEHGEFAAAAGNLKLLAWVVTL